MALIEISPTEIIEIEKATRRSKFTVKNNSMEGKGFKIKTTRPKDYIVKPNMGVIIPMQHMEVEIYLSENIEPDSSHKFLVEIYNFDWRKSVLSLKQHIKNDSPMPCYSYKLGIAYKNTNKEDIFRGKKFEGEMEKKYSKRELGLFKVVCFLFITYLSVLLAWKLFINSFK